MKKWFPVIAMTVLSTFMLAPSITAQAAGTWLYPPQRPTLVTFNRPVSLPDVTLPAGTYLFRFVDPINANGLLQVMSKDAKTSYDLVQTVPVTRPAARANGDVVFKEAPKNQPPPIAAWYYEDTEGCELIYPDGK